MSEVSAAKEGRLHTLQLNCAAASRWEIGAGRTRPHPHHPARTQVADPPPRSPPPNDSPRGSWRAVRKIQWQAVRRTWSALETRRLSPTPRAQPRPRPRSSSRTTSRSIRTTASTRLLPGRSSSAAAWSRYRLCVKVPPFQPGKRSGPRTATVSSESVGSGLSIV